MKRESKLLNKDNYKEYFSNAREFFMNYNYDEIFYDEGNTFTVKTGNKQEKIDTTDIIRWAK